jgi:hypothetical protein
MYNRDELLVAIFSFVLNAVITFFYLEQVWSYYQELKVRPNRNTQGTQDTQEVSQNTTSSEVPLVFFLIHYICKIGLGNAHLPSVTHSYEHLILL